MIPLRSAQTRVTPDKRWIMQCQGSELRSAAI